MSIRSARSFIGVSVLIVCAAFLSSQPSSNSKDPVFDEQLAKGQELLRAGKYKDAIDALKKATKLHQNGCDSCYIGLAMAYYHEGQIQEGIKSCDKAIAATQDDLMRAAAHNLKGNGFLSLTENDAKKLQAAQDEYRTAIQLDGKNSTYRLNLAKALLRESRDEEAKEALQSCLALRPDVETSIQIQLLIADPRRGREEFAPEFELVTLRGEQISSRQLSGKIVVMDFWATWCPPCRASVSELKDLTRKYPTNKLVLISVSADSDEQAWPEFVAKKNMDWAQYRDANHRVLDVFAIHRFPTYLVIDGDGFIKQRITGMNPQETVVHRLKATLERMPQLEGEVRK